MKRIITSLYILFVFGLISCTTNSFFGNKSPRQQYADQLQQAGLNNSAIGRQWIDQSNSAMETSLAVNIPYRENGYFAADVPRSAGFRLRPKRGQRLQISLSVKPQSNARLFIELWKNTNNINKPKLIAAADSSLSIVYEIDDDPELLLIIQPELLVNISYSLSITADPSLAFPVPGNNGKKVGSFWGEERGGGSRKHEGIDIFDKFRTPLIACEDGVITRVGENGLGGKVVWLSPAGKDYNLYYAHLDEQLVSPSQRVKKGDTIGLMGNTGNAKHTPSHLHFGIYASGGAVDPLPFVQQVSKETEPIKGALINVYARTNKSALLQNSPAKKAVTITELKPNTLVKIEAAMGSYYKVVLPDHTSGFIPVALITELSKAIKTVTVKNEIPLYSSPDSSAATIKQITLSESVHTLASFNNYSYVRTNKHNGWVYTNDLE